VSMRDLSPHELRTQGFSLSRPQTLQIEAVGAAEAREKNVFVRGQRDPGYWRGNAWILNARTRDVVWELRRANTKGARRDLERFDGNVQLPAGDYEVYYASYSGMYGQKSSGLSWLIGSRRRDEYDDRGLSESFRLVIRGEGRPLGPTELQRLRDLYR